MDDNFLSVFWSILGTVGLCCHRLQFKLHCCINNCNFPQLRFSRSRKITFCDTFVLQYHVLQIHKSSLEVVYNRGLFKTTKYSVTKRDSHQTANLFLGGLLNYCDDSTKILFRWFSEPVKSITLLFHLLPPRYYCSQAPLTKKLNK